MTDKQNLRDELGDLTGKRRRYLLFRIADLDPAATRSLIDLNKATFNTWIHDPESLFSRLHRRIPELSSKYKYEAVQLIRRDTQLSAAILEEKVINKLLTEIEIGKYRLIKTAFGRQILDKLLSTLDHQPQTTILTWQQRLNTLIVQEEPHASGEIIEAETVLLAEHQESQPIQEDEQALAEDAEEVEA